MIKEAYLQSGLYYLHLENWFQEFLPQQIYLIDVEKFKNDPYSQMNEIQKFFELKNSIDYKNKIYINNEKLICLNSTTSKKDCFTSSAEIKINEESKKLLKEYYFEPNKKLKHLLLKHGYGIPNWLSEY